MAKIGRNDPCPCGSGKKFKRCCGAGTQYVSPPSPTATIDAQSDAEEAARLDAILKKAQSAARSALKSGDYKAAEAAVTTVLKGEFFDARGARKEAAGMVAEILGRMDGERDMKNATNRAKRAAEKAFSAPAGAHDDMIARRDRARAAILASFEASGMGFNPDAPVVQRLLEKIAPPGG